MLGSQRCGRIMVIHRVVCGLLVILPERGRPSLPASEALSTLAVLAACPDPCRCLFTVVATTRA